MNFSDTPLCYLGEEVYTKEKELKLAEISKLPKCKENFWYVNFENSQARNSKLGNSPAARKTLKITKREDYLKRVNDPLFVFSSCSKDFKSTREYSLYNDKHFHYNFLRIHDLEDGEFVYKERLTVRYEGYESYHLSHPGLIIDRDRTPGRKKILVDDWSHYFLTSKKKKESFIFSNTDKETDIEAIIKNDKLTEVSFAGIKYELVRLKDIPFPLVMNYFLKFNLGEKMYYSRVMGTCDGDYFNHGGPL